VGPRAGLNTVVKKKIPRRSILMLSSLLLLVLKVVSSLQIFRLISIILYDFISHMRATCLRPSHPS
jgi:hypothetical protein